jgi:hypothetical protein
MLLGMGEQRYKIIDRERARLVVGDSESNTFGNVLRIDIDLGSSRVTLDLSKSEAESLELALGRLRVARSERVVVFDVELWPAVPADAAQDESELAYGETLAPSGSADADAMHMGTDDLLPLCGGVGVITMRFIWSDVNCPKCIALGAAK